MKELELLCVRWDGSFFTTGVSYKVKGIIHPYIRGNDNRSHLVENLLEYYPERFKLIPTNLENV